MVLNKLHRLIEWITPELPEPDDSDPFAAAVKAQEDGRSHDAEKAYRQILIHEPGHAGALFSLGVLRLMLFDIEEANTLIEGAVVQCRDASEGRLLMGRVLASMGYVHQALVNRLSD